MLGDALVDSIMIFLQTFERACKLDMAWPEGFEEERPKAAALIKAMMVVEPSDRLGAGAAGLREVMEHEWFEGFEWDKLHNLYVFLLPLNHALDRASVSILLTLLVPCAVPLTASLSRRLCRRLHQQLTGRRSRWQKSQTLMMMMLYLSRERMMYLRLSKKQTVSVLHLCVTWRS